MRDAPLNPQSEIPKSSKQTKIIKLNHFTSLGFQQTLQNSLGVFHSFPLTLRLLVLQFLFTKLSTSTRTSCHLNIEGPPGWGFRIPTQLFNQHFLLFGISYKNSPTKKRNPDIRKKTKRWIMNHESQLFVFQKSNLPFGILTIPVKTSLCQWHLVRLHGEMDQVVKVRSTCLRRHRGGNVGSFQVDFNFRWSNVPTKRKKTKRRESVSEHFLFVKQVNKKPLSKSLSMLASLGVYPYPDKLGALSKVGGWRPAPSSSILP